jgi:putative ABC transport system permease protein
MTLAGFALSNLARRPARTFLTILGIAFAVGTAVALLALGRGITDSVARGFDEHGAEMIASPRNATDILTGRAPEALATELAAMAGIADVSPELYAFGIAGSGQHVLVAGWARNSWVWERAPLAQGRLPAAEKEVLLGDIAARVLALNVGDRLELFEELFTVAGIAAYTTPINRGIVVMHLPALQEAALRPQQASFFSLRLDPGLDAAATAELAGAIEAKFPLVVSGTQEMMAGDQYLAILAAVSDAVSIVALSMGALSLLGTLLISVQERTREIGMLAAIGWSDARIVSLIILEGVVIGAAGSVLGLGIGIAASGLFDSLPAIGNLISFTPRAADIALPLALALPLCAAGAAYPALRAVRLLPADALRRT